MGESTEDTKPQGRPDAYRPLPEADSLLRGGLGEGSIVKRRHRQDFYRGKEPIHVLENLDLEVRRAIRALMGPSAPASRRCSTSSRARSPTTGR